MPPPDFETANGIRMAALRRVGVLDDDDTSDYEQDADDALVEKHADIIHRAPWLSLLRDPPGVLLTEAAITTLTLQATTAPPAVTLSGAPGVPILGWVIRPAGTDYIYRVTADNGATPTVDAIPETLPAGTACVIVKMEYALPDGFLLFEDGLWTPLRQFVPLKSIEALRGVAGDIPQESWPPQCFARVGDRKVRLASYARTRKRLEFGYTADPGDPDGEDDATALVISKHLRVALFYGVLSAVREAVEDPRAKDDLATMERKIAEAIEFEHLKRTGLGVLSGDIVPTDYH